MKKLLGLLGTIMITGNAIPSVIAAAPNRKHSIKKRQLPPNDKVKGKKENSQQEIQNLIEINNNIILGKEYKFLIKNILNELCEKNILNELLYVNKNKNEIYETNSDNKYFILNLKLDNETVSRLNEEEITKNFIKKIAKIDNNENNIYNTVEDSIINKNNIIKEKINLKIILSDDDFYLQGFINNENKYFYFKDSKLKKINGLNIKESIDLGYESNYNDLNVINNNKFLITKNNIYHSINKLWNYEKQKNKEIKNDLARIIFITSEAMRFNNIKYLVQNILEKNEEINWNKYFDEILKHWTDFSKNLLNKLLGFEYNKNNWKNISLNIIKKQEYEKFTTKKEYKNRILTSSNDIYNLREQFSCIMTNLYMLNYEIVIWNQLNILKIYKNSFKIKQKIENKEDINLIFKITNQQDKLVMLFDDYNKNYKEKFDYFREKFDEIKNNFKFSYLDKEIFNNLNSEIFNKLKELKEKVDNSNFLFELNSQDEKIIDLKFKILNLRKNKKVAINNTEYMKDSFKEVIDLLNKENEKLIQEYIKNYELIKEIKNTDIKTFGELKSESKSSVSQQENENISDNEIFCSSELTKLLIINEGIIKNKMIIINEVKKYIKNNFISEKDIELIKQENEKTKNEIEINKIEFLGENFKISKNVKYKLDELIN